MAIPLQNQMPALLESCGAAPEVDNIIYLAEGFSALADPTRLSIIHLLMTHGEMCVCEFMPLLNLTQSNVSFHLKALKYAQFITARKEGRWMLYRLNRTAFERFRSEFGSAFDLSRWQEEAASAPCNEATRRRLACQNQLVKGENNNANE